MRRYLFCALAMIAVAMTNTVAPAQPKPAATAAALAPQQTPTGQIQTSTPIQQDSVADGRELERKIKTLEGEIENLRSWITWAGIALGGFAALGAFGSFFSLWRFESRASQSHKVAIRGEEATQERAAEVHTTFLEGSKTTLELVNATLLLAKEASERAAHFLEEKARESLESLNREAKALLAKAPQENDRGLIADSRKRAALMSLAQKLAKFETNRFVLPRDIRLTPPCLFVLGMEHHLKQQFDDALKYWEEVALDENADKLLRSLTWYWIGYEHNNLGDFPNAISSFEQALTLSEGSRSYELERILIESRFFNNEEPTELLQPLQILLQRIDDDPKPSKELEARRIKICGTLGNIFHIIGEDFRAKNNAEEADENFNRAAQYFSQASERDLWAQFGLAEALYRAKQVEKAREMFKGPVLLSAQREGVERMEPRTKVLARQTELICYLRVPELLDRKPLMHSQVLESLSEVGDGLTVYSQLRRRNVMRREFLLDLAALEGEASA